MPVGDLPTVFPTIMTCRFKQDGNLQKRQYTQTILHFLYSVMFLIVCFFGWIMSMFCLANTYIFCIFKLTMRCCIFSAYHDIVYCSWKDLFAIYMHILHICSTWKTRDGRKCVKNFGVSGGFRTKINRFRMPVGGFSHGIPTIMTCRLKQDGNLQKTALYNRWIAFSYILSVFIDHVCFADHEHVFLQIPV